MTRLHAVTAVILLLGLNTSVQANVFNLDSGFTNLETVLVGDSGNAADTRYETSGYGAVDYNYNIGKYEVTAKQYTDFLNAKAKSDPYGLYNTQMGSNYNGCKIQRSGYANNYSYTVANEYANRPVNCVSYWDACRFANWLSNGQGNGDTENGTYTLTASGTLKNTIARNEIWNWAVASEDEWYKAAYYNGDGTYWDYATSSNTAPGRDMTDASGNNANYYDNGYLVVNRTEVGEFENSTSHYGTFDQGGNVHEWNEAIIDLNQGYTTRCQRDGSYSHTVDNIKATNRLYSTANVDSYDVGFRLVQAVPEPSSIIALSGALILLLGAKRRKA